ncbi:hypothetical protein PQ460_10740 [Paenibacillus sp. KACC 21273]|uniref:hypothetical protein n=1 Tax=Paenibacillus sp. KACC 21273 TaxID=3025665 RepID=UPI00236598B8|nr:hypothetical protein [Paenibacillus sp. KACC 21273]WDF52860.1 hypothetical protein PQ460_10740 [Paenibacillus sp. KACC 21273]
MQPFKNIRVLFHFGEEDEYEVDLQLVWTKEHGSEAIPDYSIEALSAAVQYWVAQHVSYTWEEVLSDEET